MISCLLSEVLQLQDNKMTVGEFENATKITKGDGAKQQVAKKKM